MVRGQCARGKLPKADPGATATFASFDRNFAKLVTCSITHPSLRRRTSMPLQVSADSAWTRVAALAGLVLSTAMSRSKTFSDGATIETMATCPISTPMLKTASVVATAFVGRPISRRAPAKPKP